MFQGSKFQELLNTIKGKIDAIKVIRSLDCVIEDAKNDNGVTIQRIRVNIGLKDAKDLVEKIGSIYTLEQDAIKVETVASLVAENDRLRKSYAELDDKFYNLQTQVGQLYRSINSQ